MQCMNLWEDHPDVAPLTFHPRVGQAAAELLGVDAVRLWHDQALYKQAGGRVTDPHQDHPYWPIKETASVTAWIPFEGSTVASGAMAYLPGIAHDRPAQVREHLLRRARGHPRRPRGRRASSRCSSRCRRGAVAFHHGLTVHLAGAEHAPTATAPCTR